MKRMNQAILLATLLGVTGSVMGQSSSLYLVDPNATPVQAAPVAGQRHGGLTPTLVSRASYAAVIPPEPRVFAVHDLVTIVVRESSSARSNASLETSKETGIDGKVSAFPNLRPEELIRGRVAGSTLSNPPEVGLEFNSEYTGEGDYERKDEIITRLTARVVDVKPNGMLALEARTHIRNDEETVTIKLTGYCRSDDVGIDNTVLSTQMFDLHLDKTHTGELRKASKKGLLSKLLDLVFNF